MLWHVSVGESSDSQWDVHDIHVDECCWMLAQRKCAHVKRLWRMGKKTTNVGGGILGIMGNTRVILEIRWSCALYWWHARGYQGAVSCEITWHACERRWQKIYTHGFLSLSVLRVYRYQSSISLIYFYINFEFLNLKKSNLDYNIIHQLNILYSILMACI